MEAANKESPFEERGRTNRELVGLLISRGLGGEPSDILRALETVGYFRLKGYLFPLLKNGAADKSFADGATIGQAWELYTIDRKLRVMVFEALARIEVAIRALIVRSHLERNDDPMAYADAVNMPHLSEAMYANLLDHIRGACRKSSAEPMIRHLKEKYGITNTPPIWTMMEVVEFGTVTLYYQGLPTDVQRLVADAFHVPPNALGGVLNLLRRARNVCAHHSRFWNRRINAGVSSGLGNAPEIAPLEECLRAASEQKGTSAFVTLSLVAYCMSVFRPESEWKPRCRDFLAARDTFVLRGMGFPADWQTLALWK